MKTHKDLDVWKKSVDFVTIIYKETQSFPKEELYGLTSQMRRAAVSIPSNIAEGSARQGNKELVQFLYIALGSVVELDTQLIMSQVSKIMYKKYIKRILDFLAAFFGLLVLSPIFILVTICLYFANQGKPFFFQLRPGKGGKIFKIVKFKTMNDKTDKAGNLLPDAERITPVGAFVRKTSLDEIPQLINVLKGDMSLIGPRPLLVQYLPLYNAHQARRHEVPPGITGWAQVNGRNAISWQQKFDYDVWYVDNISFALDLKILFLTIKKVFVREGISAEGQATMEVFRGNENYEI